MVCLTLNTHLDPITSQSTCNSVSSQVSFSISDLYSESAAGTILVRIHFFELLTCSLAHLLDKHCRVGDQLQLHQHTHQFRICLVAASCLLERRGSCCSSSAVDGSSVRGSSSISLFVLTINCFTVLVAVVTRSKLDSLKVTYLIFLTFCVSSSNSLYPLN